MKSNTGSRRAPEVRDSPRRRNLAWPLALGAARANPDSIRPRVVRLCLRTAAAPPTRLPLFDAIPKRQCLRDDCGAKTVSSVDLQTLTAAAAVPGVDLILITDRPNPKRIRDLVIAGNSAQMSDEACVSELRSWMRFIPRGSPERRWLVQCDDMQSDAAGVVRADDLRPGVQGLFRK